MTDEYIFLNLEALLRKYGIHKLILCSALKISLACLEDFLAKRLKPTPEMFEILRELFAEYSKEATAEI